ncbi:exported hypothetical protein [Burkholderiales bacterium]|nr:exported hypothetical protein [Burkholderiales bacterium]
MRPMAPCPNVRRSPSRQALALLAWPALRAARVGAVDLLARRNMGNVQAAALARAEGANSVP